MKELQMKNWFEIENKANSPLKVAIVGDIGSNGISAAAFKKELDKFKGVEALEMDIYSQGGNMYDGLFMFDYLSHLPAHKTARVVNIAASAATLPLMAMDVVNMPANSKIMIHQPMATMFMADSDMLRKAASHMDDMQAVAVDIYQHKTKLSREKLSDMIKAETYMTAQEAKDLGFADKVTAQFGVDNRINDLDGITSLKEFENFLREAGGFSRTEATGIVAKAKGMFQREAEGSAEQQAINRLQAQLSGLKIPTSLTA